MSHLLTRLPSLFHSHKSSQGITYENAFKLGSLLQTRLLIITLHATLNTKDLLNGSSVGVFSISGNPLILSCGFTENVRASVHPPFHQFDHTHSKSRRRQEHNLVCATLSLPLRGTDLVLQLRNHTRYHGFARVWKCLCRVLLFRFQGHR